ncbi:hypothetical protein [Komagataeibacter xylinus]|uniref:hypothetical protein n=1 Tax=Komagataeibacter xylinus TaxID=28448 RepID=UPI00280A6C30|nr:hypothetical protein [Komagataeibacter xylinus]
MRKIQNLTGKKFGSLTVIDLAEPSKHRVQRWLCKCDCGADHISPAGNLIKGTSLRCRGCANVLRIKTMRAFPPDQHKKNAPRARTVRPAPIPASKKPTSIERQYRTMLANGDKIHPDNCIRFSNFTEVRLYDRLIQRDVDKMTQGAMG